MSKKNGNLKRTAIYRGLEWDEFANEPVVKFEYISGLIKRMPFLMNEEALWIRKRIRFDHKSTIHHELKALRDLGRWKSTRGW